MGPYLPPLAGRLGCCCFGEGWNELCSRLLASEVHDVDVWLADVADGALAHAHSVVKQLACRRTAQEGLNIAGKAAQ